MFNKLRSMALKNPKSVNKKFQSILFSKDVTAGEGYMKDGQYVAYTPAEKEHIQNASKNKDAEFKETQTNSLLGTYQEPELKNNTQKIKKRKLGDMSLLGSRSILGG